MDCRFFLKRFEITQPESALVVRLSLRLPGIY
jgi:hypothetical protein